MPSGPGTHGPLVYLPPTVVHLPMRNWTALISVQSNLICILYKNINKLPHNSKTIALSNFVLITKIIVHGNMHPKDYWSLTLTLTFNDKSSISSQNGKFDLWVVFQGQSSMMQNHSPWQYTSCDLLIFDLDIDLEGQIVNFIKKWQIWPSSCLSRSEVNETKWYIMSTHIGQMTFRLDL